MRKIFIIVLALLVLLLGLVLILPGLIPSEVYKDKIESQLSQELGRNVSIAGDVKLQSLPFIRAKTSNVTISNFEGFEATEFVALETLEARIRLLPLLSRRVEISGFDLIKPIINLERRSDGRANWENPEGQPQADSRDAPFKRDGRFSLIDPQIEAFKLIEGIIDYKDAVSGQSYRFEDIDGSFSLQGMSSSLKLNINLEYKEQPMDLTLVLDSPRAFLDGKNTPVEAELESAFGTIIVNGDFLESTDIDFRGLIDGEITDVSGLVSFLPQQDISYTDLASTVTAKANVSYINGTFETNQLDLTASGNELRADYKGSARLEGDTVSANGEFNVTVETLSNLLEKLNIKNDYADLLRTVAANGTIKIQGPDISLTQLSATARNGLVNGRYEGGLTLSEKPVANGMFNVSVTDFFKVAEVLRQELPYSESIKTLEASGQIETQGETFLVKSLDATLRNGLLNGSYKGEAKVALNNNNAFSINGKLDANISDVRSLAALNGTNLPPDTDRGAIFETLTVKGDLSGNADRFTLSGADISFDQIKGKGSASLLLSETKPFLDADLTLASLDLQPYMASYSAQNPTGEIQPWSEQPINVEVFRALDGEFEFSTPNVLTDRLRLGQTNINATVRNGRLVADLPNLSLYGGGGSMNVAFDASKSVPSLTLNAGLDKLNGNNFLTAIAGFTKATGQAQTNLTISATGISQAEIMRNLNGQGGFNLISGSIQGIDAQQFLTGLDQAFTSRQLPSGIGAEYTTKFRDIVALFDIKNGVVSIDEFTLNADQLSATGVGEIDLGNQTLDFRFRPRVKDENANKLAAFGIPLKFSGEFGSASAGLDAEFLTQVLTARAKAEASKRITDNVGGPIGDILGGVIGGSRDQIPEGQGDQNQDNDTNGTDTPSSESGTDSNETDSPPSAEETLTNALSGLLGLSSQSDTSGKEEEQNEASEEKK